MPLNHRRFDGKVIVVTGGSSGIGGAAALAFAREGAKVVIAARGLERGHAMVRQIKSNGGTSLFIPTDVSHTDQVIALFEEVIAAFGRIDCAFNNAADPRADEFARTADLTEEQFDHSITVNLKSVWLCMRQEIRQMLSQEPRGGIIVNTSSVNGLGGVPNGALYSAAKAGVLALTKSAALEYGKDGIRINALVAGAFRTPMLAKAIDMYTHGDPAIRQQVEERYRQMTALGRIGDPDEAAQAVLWLCSGAASYMAGHSLILDGGLTAFHR